MGLFRILFGTGRKADAERDQYSLPVIGKNLISPINTTEPASPVKATGM
jgi:hypothetical protein